MKRKKIFILALFISLIVFSGIIIIASTITSSRGELEVTNSNITIESSSALDTSTSSDWVYKKAGDKKLINVSLKNSSNENIHRYYQLSLNNDVDTTLKSAILVYYNGEFINTLSELVLNTNTYIDVPTSMTKTNSTSTDSFTFELHQAASNSIFNSKKISINISVFAENIDYERYALVSNDSEFVKVIDDINSGLLDNIPTIVLANPITLSSLVTIKEPITIETNGNGITGSIKINDDNTNVPNALIRIEGNGSINSITLGDYYDKNGALDLIVEHASNQLKYGLQADSINPQKIDIIGPYSFYSGITISNSGDASYNAGTLTASKDIEFTKLAALTISNTKNTNKTEIINYKHIGIKSAFGESEVLNHIPNNEKIITNDLFLPTFIPSYNASIEWKSSDTSIISNEGKIVKDKCDGEAITLTATIKLNNKTYTRVFKFKVTSNNNMVNFQKLVKDISPLIIKKKYSNSDAANTTYNLPIVTEYNTSNKSFGNYDYRQDYKSPSDEPTFNWTAHEDIGLKSLTYSPYDSELYYYIGLTDTSPNNGVMLIQDTLSNYAKIKISGEFNGEICEGIINISISLGSDTELLEKAFNHINNELDDISILGNIIVTRLSDGILNEKGDFSLPSIYDEDYIISYNLLSENTGLKISIDEENSCYHFAVDPTTFTSVEAAVPVEATVKYTKSSGAEISKTKIIYVTLPAALHISDLGNISIFNSLKYQVINALPNDEKNNNTGFTTSNGIVSYSGYDYILLRDIVGDIEYINNYSFDGNYLKDTGYKLDGSNGANGVTSITLVNSSTNNASTTDTLAYDFIKLIQWATGDTKVTAASVLSSDGQGKIDSIKKGYTSNGETYLTENELAVIEAFYKACTNANETKWSTIKSQVLETAPGRIYDNATLIETILNCLTTEKGINSGWYENNSDGTYGKIYAKYLEIVNRYATTTSENEEPMSPAQEVYNSKFYYSFTSTAANSTTSGNAAISIPCKYYDIEGKLISGYCNRYALPILGDFRWQSQGSGKRQGVYAASKITDSNSGIEDWSDVNIYASGDTNPYDSDKTKYITSAELMVIKAFWLGALAGTQYANTDSSNGVLHTFSSDSISKIDKALQADSNGILPYPNYTRNDFQCYGQAILNAFDACLTIPTTFTSNGIGLLINSFYDNYNSTGYKVREYGKADDKTKFDSVLVNSIPAVTNLDNIEGALSYFSKLKSINIIGDESLAIYLSDYGLSTSFARICLTNKEITSLNMQYVSSNWNNFDITNIKHLDNLKNINISNNIGIKSVYPLLNINRNKYEMVNFYNIGEVFDYNEFVIDNLAAQLVYSNKNGAITERAKDSSIESSPLVYLSDIEDLVSEHLYLTNVIYDENNTDICWRIEEGNEINKEEINQGGELEVIEDIREMNMRVSPYFYCNNGFSYNTLNFIAGGLYKIVSDPSGVTKVTPINIDSNSDITFNISIASEVPSIDYENISVDDVNLTIYDPHLAYDGEFSKKQNSTGTTGNIYSQESSINANNTVYRLDFKYYLFSFEATIADGTEPILTYYLRCNSEIDSESNITYGDAFEATTAATAIDSYFVLLTKDEADFIVSLRDNAFVNTTDNILEKYGISAVDNVITLGQDVPTTNGKSISNIYIFNVANNKFLTLYGFSSNPITGYTIKREARQINGGSNTAVYSVYSKETNYLAQSKISTKESSAADDDRVGLGVIYYSKLANDHFATAWEQYSRFRTWWFCSSSAIYEKTTSLNSTEKTPLLTTTEGIDGQAVATFNTYYINNGSLSNNGNPSDTTATLNNFKTENGTNYTYRMYDTGAFLLINYKPSIYGENAKFCFLTEDEKNNLENWYKNPYRSMTFGSDPSNSESGKYYYIYCPYTRRFITGGTTGYGTSKNGEMYQTSADFSKAQLYYMNKVNSKYGNTFINAVPDNDINSFNGGDESGFNAYGGVNSANYIAVYHSDANTTCIMESAGTFEITYTISAQTKEYISYQLDYEIVKVSSHYLKQDISKEYQVDKFYYLTSDVNIDGIIYKAGNVIRFVVDAYYGKQYEYDIEYYELILHYYNSSSVRDDTTKKTVLQFNSASYVYYYYNNEDEIVPFNGEILYLKQAVDGVNEEYNKTASYTTHNNPEGVSVNFNDPRLVLSENVYNSIKEYLYKDINGTPLEDSDAFDENKTYYKEKIEQSKVFEAEFNSRKNSLYKDENGTPLEDSDVFEKGKTYFELGYSRVSSATLTAEKTFAGNGNFPITIFEYYKHGIYIDEEGTRVSLSSSYDSNMTYYFLQGDGTYSTELPKYYSSTQGYVSLVLNAETFEYFKHSLYKEDNGNYILVTMDEQYNMDSKYYKNDYIISKFKDEVLSTYRDVLYKDSEGRVSVGIEETFDPNIIYYSNVFSPIIINTKSEFDTMRYKLYLNEYGKPIPSNYTFISGTYYTKTYEQYQPCASGNTTDEWITEKMEVKHLYSHTKLISQENLDTYFSDYAKVYNNGKYPIVYKYIGEGSENIYAEPTMNYKFVPIRTGTITEQNFERLKGSLYLNSTGTPVGSNAFNPETIYYKKEWDIDENLVSKDISYKQDWGYYLERKDPNNGDYSLKWTEDPDGINSNSSKTMDEILEEANSHFNDSDYNLYYGKYYGYNGFTMKSSSVICDVNGNSLGGYDKGYIYRIVLNSNNSAFIWQKIQKYTRIDGATMVTYASTGVAQPGQVYYATSACFNTFYTAGKFYRIVEDDFTKTLNVVQFTDVAIDNYYMLSTDEEFIENKKYYTFKEVSNTSYNVGDSIIEYTYYEKVNNYYVLTSDENFVDGKKYYLRNNVSDSYVDGTLYYESNITDIQSQKIHYIYQSDYLGYAGTYEIVISAVIRKANEYGSYTDSIKKYKIKFVGTVIS